MGTLRDLLDFGCRDRSCVFGKPVGMCTNGGCQCVKNLRPGYTYSTAQRAVKLLEDNLTVDMLSALDMLLRLHKQNVESEYQFELDMSASEHDYT